MKKALVATALLATFGVIPAFAQGIEVGVGVGAAIPASGDLGGDSFSDVFDPGVSLNAYATGPLWGIVGWRGEFGFDRTSSNSDFDDVLGDVDLDFVRFGGGIMLQQWSEAKGRPYGFLTVGGYNQELSGDLESESQTDFGMAFGGGYNWRIGENWGVGGDLRVNGVFSGEDALDETVWYVTPSGQLFFRF